MHIYKSLLIILAVFSLFWIIQHILRSTHPIYNILKSSLAGVISLIAINIYYSQLIPINIFSLGVSAIAGIPGISTMIIISNIIFN